jgi:hypothetical protein
MERGGDRGRLRERETHVLRGIFLIQLIVALLFLEAPMIVLSVVWGVITAIRTPIPSIQFKCLMKEAGSFQALFLVRKQFTRSSQRYESMIHNHMHLRDAPAQSSQNHEQLNERSRLGWNVAELKSIQIQDVSD